MLIKIYISSAATRINTYFSQNNNNNNNAFPKKISLFLYHSVMKTAPTYCNVIIMTKLLYKLEGANWRKKKTINNQSQCYCEHNKNHKKYFAPIT